MHCHWPLRRIPLSTASPFSMRLSKVSRSGSGMPVVSAIAASNSASEISMSSSESAARYEFFFHVRLVPSPGVATANQTVWAAVI